MRFVLPLLLVLLLMPMVVFANSVETTDSYRRISMLLFPETAGWTAVVSMKRANEKWLEENLPELKKIYSAKKVRHFPEDYECNWLETITVEQYENFYLYDVDKDGLTDVVYTGDNHCFEGNLTVVWFASKSGYELREDYLSQYLLLSVSVGQKFRFSSIRVGCCGDPVDVYELGIFDDNVSGVEISITKPTELPHSVIPRKKFTTDGEIALRESPRIDDTYDAGFSTTVNFAVLGNVLSRYLPGCSGIVVGDSPDSAPGWTFVLLDKACGPLRTHLPFDVDAGWVETRQLNLNKQ